MRRRRRLLLTVVGGVVAVEALWLLAFHWAATSGRLERWVSRRPDRFVMRFASARSYAPFHVAFSGLEFAVQTPRWQWSVAADHASAEISPLPLLQRRLRFHRLAGEGVRVTARRRATSAAEAETSRPFVAEIAPWPLFEASPAPWRFARHAWSYEFPAVRAVAVRELWIERVRFTGRLAAAGAFHFRRRREAEIEQARLDLTDGGVTLSGEPLAEGLAGQVRGAIAPYRYRERRGVALLPYLTAEGAISGGLFDGALLRRYLARAAWLEFDAQTAPFAADVKIHEGRLAPGTRVELSRPRRRFDFFGFEARGDSRLELVVVDEAVAPRVDLALRFDEFDLRRQGEADPDFAGRGLELTATTRDPRLGALPDDAQIRLELGEATLIDLRSLGSLLPAAAGIELLGGSGPVAGGLRVDVAENRAEGRFSARIRGARVRVGKLESRGDLSFAAPVTSRAVGERTFELDGARLELLDFSPPAAAPAGAGSAEGGGEPWWAHVELPRARLRLAAPGELRGEVTARLKDSAPLVALYDSRRNLPAWVEGLLSAPGVVARSDFGWRRGELDLSGLRIELDHAGIAANLELRQRERRGRILLSWRKLALGIELTGIGRNYRFQGARAWYGGVSSKISEN